MLFDTFPFWAILLALWIAFLVIRSNFVRKALLVAGSYFFYFLWQAPGALLLLAVTLLSYWWSRALQRSRRRGLLLIAISVLLATLAFFKYASLLPQIAWFAPGRAHGLLAIGLPLGISFYIIQVISYLVDSYRGHLEEKAGLLDYALYVSFFPHVIAGPILRGDDFVPQLRKRTAVTPTLVWEGLVLIAFGLFKKLAIADNMAFVADPVFANLHTSGNRIVLATLAYAAQIYCDFAGYSDIAIGISRLFGYRLPQNFNWPYLSLNPVDFWRRWHITLSTWLRDYIFFALPGRRSKSKWPAHRNLIITMTLCGLWHGAAWTFVLWGTYHGCLLVGYRLFERRRPSTPIGPLWLREIGSILLTQLLVVIGWILFRLNHLSDLPTYVASLWRGPFSTVAFNGQERLVLWLLIVFWIFNMLEFRVPVTQNMLRRPWNPYVLIALVLLGTAGIVLTPPLQTPFIYFRF